MRSVHTGLSARSAGIVVGLWALFRPLAAIIKVAVQGTAVRSTMNELTDCGPQIFAARAPMVVGTLLQQTVVLSLGADG